MSRFLCFFLFLGCCPLSLAEKGEEPAAHWSFQPVTRPALPLLPAGKANPVDMFLDKRLKKVGVAANEPADARALIRRLSVILTGLAPEPARVKAFERAFAADGDTAYSGLVDELLASRHFGERWAQHWLDVIRWAETNGSEANLYRKMAWVYRDYVVSAFNEDVPYDRFVREQLAGDTLGRGEATGFLVSGPHVPAATVGQIPEAIRQARADRMDEVIQTVASSLLGLTMNCARCHDHKFDPVSIDDYYSMAAIFQGVEFGSRSPEFGADHPRRQRGEALLREIALKRKKLRGTGPWQEDWGGYRELHFGAAKFKAVRVNFKTPYVGIDELELFGPDAGQGNLALASRGTRVSGPDHMAQRGRTTVNRVNDGEYGTMAWRARSPKGSKEKPWVLLEFSRPQVVNHIRVSTNREYYYEVDYLTIKPKLDFSHMKIEGLGINGQWRTLADTHFIEKINKERVARVEPLKRIQSLIAEYAEQAPQPSFVGRFVEPVVTRVMHRGSPENLREEVMPAAPRLLSGDLKLNSGTPGEERRASFARWVTRPDNPLLARVMVNRIWQHIFGRGIVPTGSDFGRAGAKPSHPELLDWLASEFMEPKRAGAKSWSVKDTIRLLVHSDAFKRSSQPAGHGAGGELLWRFPPRRVEAEVIRDGILQASGKLDSRIGGRSYRIHNVKKTYAQWQVTDNHGPHTWRRMLYQERMRRVDDQIFTAFDFPDCGQVRAKRPVSTTPLQALNLMNSPFVVEQSAFIAARAEKESGKGAPAVRRCFELLLGRQPLAGELESCLAVAESRGLNFVARALINTNEFAFIP
ncbi:MAG: DUF1549 and DUF1553 domain-containing protein [Verrucomicrobiales bacterium]|nr:DUF1549 and DUF1553 domain-containing protein [Verrucomicrobiales bacterium]